MRLDEKQLNGVVRSGNISGLFFLYGKELFLSKMYGTRLVNKTLGNDFLDMNYTALQGNPDAAKLAELVDGLPVFADKKVVSISDFDPEKSDTDTVKKYIEIFKNIPPETVLVIYAASVELDDSKAKTKKIIAAAEKSGTVCKFEPLSMRQISEKIMQKVTKAKRVISSQNADYIAQMVMCDLTSASNETSKLISYIGEGEEITREFIDKLVTKQTAVKVFDLATAIVAGRKQNALDILDDLFSLRTEPVIILSALSTSYVDFYRAKITKKAGLNPTAAVNDFAYPRNRAWAVEKAYNSVRNISTAYLRSALAILNSADIKLKSSAVSNRIILEEAIVKLMVTEK